MRRTKKDAEITRQQILDTALLMFGEKGFDSTRLADIAKAAGVTRGAIYWHFKNKDDLIITMVKEFSESFYKIMEDAMEKEGSPKENLLSFFRIISNKMLYDKNMQAMRMLENYYYTKPEIIKELIEYYGDRHQHANNQILSMVMKAQENNEISDQHMPHDVMMFMFCLGGGIIGLIQDKTSGIKPENINIDKFVELLDAAFSP